MTGIARLKEGAAIRVDGERHVVSRVGAYGLTLRDPRGEFWGIGLEELLSTPDYRVLDVRTETVKPARAVQLPKEQRAQAEQRFSHLQEALTGFSEGDGALARPGEPRPEFDTATTTKQQRFRAKETELGIGSQALDRWDGASRVTVCSVSRMDAHCDRATRPAGSLTTNARRASRSSPAIASAANPRSRHSSERSRSSSTAAADLAACERPPKRRSASAYARSTSPARCSPPRHNANPAAPRQRRPTTDARPITLASSC